MQIDEINFVSAVHYGDCVVIIFINYCDKRTKAKKLIKDIISC